MSDDQDLTGLTGRAVNGYRALRLLAQDHAGALYEGVHDASERAVTLRFFHPRFAADPAFRPRFERAARAAARLNHPAIVRVLDFGLDGALAFLVADAVESEPLARKLGAAVPAETVINLIPQAAAALAAAHRLDEAHGDVNPETLLLTPDGRLLLTGFGLAAIVGPAELANPDAPVGQPAYLAPEQVRGEVPRPASDLYALATVTYALLTGRTPFAASTPSEVLVQQRTQAPPSPRTVAPGLSPEVEAVLLRALAKDPAARQERVNTFVSQLLVALSAPATGAAPAGALSGASAAPAPAGSPGATATRRAARGSYRLLAIGVGVLVALVALGGAWLAPILGAGGAKSGVAASPTAQLAAGTPTAVAAARTPTAAPIVAADQPTIAPTPAAATPAAATATMVMAAAPTGSPAASGTPRPAAAEAPDMQLAVVFSSQRGDAHDSQIFIMDPNGGNQRQLIASRGHAWGPRVSPDGRRLMFSSVAPSQQENHDAMGGMTGMTNPGNHDIYIGAADGTDITNITAKYNSWDNGWSWAPDGKTVAFATDRDGNWEIYSMTPNGDAIARLTNNPAQDGWPSWTPDGKRIVFTSNRSGNWEIYAMDQDGENVKRLTFRPETVNTFPFVSPDGSRIVFSAQNPIAERREADIYVMNIDGSNLKRLTQTIALNNIPSWCPDGDRIVYTSDQTGDEEIWIMNADGSNPKRLTTSPGEDTTPSCAYIRRAKP